MSRPVPLNGTWGTVYVFQDAASPSIVKVGTTERMSKTRKREVCMAAANGAFLRQVYAVDMPFAHAVETLAHRRLRRMFRQHARGDEWYVVQNARELGAIVQCIERSARDIRASAIRRNRWPSSGEEVAKTWRWTGTHAVKERLFA